MPEIRHGDWVELKSKGRKDTVTLGHLKQFMARAEAKKVPDDAEITVTRGKFKRRVKLLRLDSNTPHQQESSTTRPPV